MSAPELSRQLRLILESSPDAPSLPTLLENIDAYVQEYANAPDAEAVSLHVEDRLQTICSDVLDHSVCAQLEVFLAVLYHLLPVLPSLSVISSWFEVVIRPALREPKLATSAVNHAKELILRTLELPTEADGNIGDEERGRREELIGNFRRRLMDFYLLDAYNESSGHDVLEWASLDDLSREKKACWKANLEDVLIKLGLQRPEDLLTEVFRCFASPPSRLQLLLLLNSFTSQAKFPDVAHVMASHVVTQSLLYSFTFDNSTTLCTIGLTMLTKLLPIFAVKACEDLKRVLPQLLIVLARTICWKQRAQSSIHDLTPEDLGMSSDIVGNVVESTGAEDTDTMANRNTLPIRPDLDWERLDLVFYGATPVPPSPHQFFQFLYYLFPCNTLRFLRYPISYLTENNVESPYTVTWDDALDEDMIRSKSESLLRGHVLHPLLIWRDATSELAQPDFWNQYDIPRIVGECTMLDVRHASLGLRQQQLFGAAKPAFAPASATSLPESIKVAEPASVSTLSSSVESSTSSVLAHVHGTAAPRKTRISLQEMINASIALKSGLEIEIVDSMPTWPTALFQQPRTTSTTPSLVVHTRPTTPDTVSLPGRATDDVPSHVAQAIAELQREVLLLRSELNFELWMARENVKHIGRLYHDRVLSRNAEVERQGLHNKMRGFKAEVQRLQKELKDHKDQTLTMKNQYLDYNQKLQDKLRELRAEKSSWQAEATAMRAADKESKDTFAAQGKLLDEATHRVFQLETTIKENAHKIDRLHDYERQIEQLVKMQRLWETDVHQLNEQNEYLKIFTNKYRKMELQVETYESILAKMEEDAKHQRLQVQTLESRLTMAQNTTNNHRNCQKRTSD
ncbi:unnamed protein product [Somion occarium]|uniref:Hamartin n=1 Tax=Somion occarium TaxID=3059160 RepID=A0ABP1D9F5_9APHY